MSTDESYRELLTIAVKFSDTVLSVVRAHFAEKARHRETRKALHALLDRYVSGANSGDWGNWDPEDEIVVVAARAALARNDLDD